MFQVNGHREGADDRLREVFYLAGQCVESVEADFEADGGHLVTLVRGTTFVVYGDLGILVARIEADRSAPTKPLTAALESIAEHADTSANQLVLLTDLFNDMYRSVEKIAINTNAL